MGVGWRESDDRNPTLASITSIRCNIIDAAWWMYLLVASSSLPPPCFPLQFDSSGSKRFYEISTTVPGLPFIHNHSKSFDFLSIEILRRRVCIFDSKSNHLIFGTESLRGQSWRVKEGIRPSVSRIPSFHSLFLSSSRVSRSNRRVHDTQSGSQWRLSPRHG